MRFPRTTAKARTCGLRQAPELFQFLFWDVRPAWYARLPNSKIKCLFVLRKALRFPVGEWGNICLPQSWGDRKALSKLEPPELKALLFLLCMYEVPMENLWHKHRSFMSSAYNMEGQSSMRHNTQVQGLLKKWRSVGTLPYVREDHPTAVVSEESAMKRCYRQTAKTYSS